MFGQLIRLVRILVRNLFRSEMANVHTFQPGRVESYTAATNTCSVQPCIKRVRLTDPNNLKTVNLPVLEDVPVWQHGSGKLIGTVAPAVGSYGVILFAERSIEKWILGGDIQDPAQMRRFSLSDAVFLPGLYPLAPDGDNGLIVVPVDDDRISLRTRLGTTEISVLDDNTVEIKTPAGSVTVDAAGLVTVGNGGSFVATAAKVEAMWTTLHTVFTNWVPAPQDGGAALKTAFLAAVTPPFDAKSTNLKAD